MFVRNLPKVQDYQELVPLLAYLIEHPDLGYVCFLILVTIPMELMCEHQREVQMLH